MSRQAVLSADATSSPGILKAAVYSLPMPADRRRALATGWLMLGLTSLVLSGVFSVLLVLSRTPYLNKLFPVADFFRVALVVHVDLSVLVWFVALAGMLWSINGTAVGLVWGRLALGVCAAGTALMSAAPFIAGGEAIMSNYIPVLDQPVFLVGLTVFGGGAAVLVVRALAAAHPLGVRFDATGSLRFGLHAAAVSAAVAVLAFGWSYVAVPRTLEGKAYYELLFWGGGHALQFTWTLLMLVAWLWLIAACGGRVPLSPRITVLMFLLALACVFVTPLAYLAYDIGSVQHRNLLTWSMRFGGGLAILPMSLAVLMALRPLQQPLERARPLRAALIASVVLFAAGGLIGLAISGSNVKIPAHYHGSIVGVTLALMGLVYHLLPQLGYGAPQPRLATLQPYLYGAGQLMHITGLLWSGGYGVQRKVAGAEQVLRSPGEVAGMGLMGLGGLIAIVGGLLFVIIVIRAIRAAPQSSPAA
jgi:hypothetical protein